MIPSIRAHFVIAGALLLAFLACTGGGPSKPAKSPSGGSGPAAEAAARVFIVGIDGASWTVLDPAMRAGRMPNLARLVERGSRAVLQSMDPTASAILWTTLATGKSPAKHGIRGFVVPSATTGKPVPVTSNLRRVEAIWNIASHAGLTVGFLAWWATWPAEAVHGFMASDYTWPLRKDQHGYATGVNPDLDIPYRTWPPDLIDDLAPYIRVEARIEPAELRRLGIAAVPKVEGYSVRDMMLKDISVGEMVTPLLDRFDPDLFAVYFDGFDAYCHLFWPIYERYMNARSSGETSLGRMNPRERALGAALDLHLTRIDDYLGDIMAHAGPGDVVMVISDHGYGDNPGRGPIMRGYDEWIRPPHWHTLHGIFAAAGGPIRAGAEGTSASVLDVTPTVLALLGLPVGDDMDGHALVSLFTAPFAAAHPVAHIPTYETGTRGEGQEAMASPYDESILDRLRALGYIN